MSFKSQLAQDGINCFLNDDEFGEVISYTPEGQSSKDIKALVVRSRVEPGTEDQGRILQNQVEVYIANDATKGITSVDKGNDLVTFPEIEGGTPISWAVISILGKDSGVWHLLVQK